MKKFTKDQAEICFGQLKILTSYLIESRGFRASNLSTYDFSTLYTTLPDNVIKQKLTALIESTFQRECSSFLACNDRNAFFTSDGQKKKKKKKKNSLNFGLVKMFVTH